MRKLSVTRTVRIELIGGPTELVDWLADHGLPGGGAPTSLPALLVLRAHARAVTEALATGRAIAADDLAALQRALAEPRGRLVLGATGEERPRLAFAPDGDESAAFHIALSLARFIESGQRHRLKLCANPGCGFAFLDVSANNTRRWCDMRFCGNRLKVRAFRRRAVPAPR
jgi:predicted RNA-binding Zn ribbon-like protein